MANGVSLVYAYAVHVATCEIVESACTHTRHEPVSLAECLHRRLYQKSHDIKLRRDFPRTILDDLTGMKMPILCVTFWKTAVSNWLLVAESN